MTQPKALLKLLLLILVISQTAHAEDVILSHSKIKELALSQGLESELATSASSQAKLEIQSAKSIYDTLLKASANYEHDKNQKSTPLFGTDNKTTNFNTELQQRTPLGTSLSVGFGNMREKTNSPFTTFPDIFSNQVYTSLRQPIAKNFFGNLDRKTIELAKKKAEALDHTAQARVQSYVFQCLVAYWQLYLAQNNFALDQVAYKKSLELFNANQNKKKLGLIEDADLLNFASNKDIRKSQLLESEMNLSKAQQQLAKELNLYPQTIKPASQKELFLSKKLPSLDALLATAFAQRPDYLAKKRELEVAAINLKMAKNKLWPQIDVLGSLNLNGVDSNYSQALDNIGGKHPKWQIGLEFNLPLQNRDSRSEVKIGEFAKKDKIIELKKIENEITSQINNSYTNYKIQSQRIAVLSSAINHTKQRFEAETLRFNQGRSDSNAVLQAETDYIEAQKMLLQAKISFRFAETDLLYAQGNILQ